MKHTKKTFFGGFVFFLNEHVYEPGEDTFLLAENLNVQKNDIVLDLGTGCGILAVLAAEKAKNVLAVDINPYAIKCAKKNAQINGVKNRIEFRSGDLFQPITADESFSLIIFNAPYLPSEPFEKRSWIGKAWAGGVNGRKIIDRFIIDAPKHLTDRGRILFVQSSLSNIKKTLSKFSKANLAAEVNAWVKVPFETLVLIEANCLF